MFTLIVDGDVYAPEPRGKTSVLLAGDRIAKVGEIDRRALDRLGVHYEVLDAADCIVVPGFVDPHGHLLGSSGEGSLALGSPMMFVDEIVAYGVTTVVGTLGVDTTMKTINGLLARVKSLNELGLSARMWTGGYNVPPSTVTGGVRTDILFIDEIVGAGEIAISDERGLNQSAQELAKLVRDIHVGGMLSGKAGLAHFHVGEEETRLQPLRDIVDDFQVQCEWLYPTHVQRNDALLGEAIDLANAGAFVDMDAVNEDLMEWVPKYLDRGGPPEKLTLSSDMDSSTPKIFHDQWRCLVTDAGIALDVALPFITRNTAQALKLENKGFIGEGADGDVVVMTKDTLDVVHVVARGHTMVADGTVLVREKWLEKSKRRIQLIGDEGSPRS